MNFLISKNKLLEVVVLEEDVILTPTGTTTTSIEVNWLFCYSISSIFDERESRFGEFLVILIFRFHKSVIFLQF